MDQTSDRSSREGSSRTRVPDVAIVDAHHHLWDLRHSYPWLQDQSRDFELHGDDSALRRDYLESDLVGDAAPIRLVSTVAVEAAAGDPRREAEWLQEQASTKRLPGAIVAGVRLEALDVSETLEYYAELPNVRGVRQILCWHLEPGYTYNARGDLMTDPAWLNGFNRLSSLGLSFDLQIYPSQIPEAAHLAAAHPGVEIILNHAGMPIDRSEDGLLAWRAGLRRLAAHPNVSVKISGLGMTDHLWTVDSMRPIVHAAIETFGPDRCMFASNFPVDSLYGSYGALYAAYDELVRDFAERERADLFALTAVRKYRLADLPGWVARPSHQQSEHISDY